MFHYVSTASSFKVTGMHLVNGSLNTPKREINVLGYWEFSVRFKNKFSFSTYFMGNDIDY